MNKYENGKIYTIRCRNDDTLIYVGSTIQSLSQRWSCHKGDGLKNLHIPLYQAINNNWHDWYIELLEPFNCNSKEELNKREGEVIREIGTLNKNIAGRTMKEWYNDNANRIKEKTKEYQKTNSNHIREQKKEYNKEHKEERKTYKKEWYDLNRDIINEKRRLYRLKKKRRKTTSTNHRINPKYARRRDYYDFLFLISVYKSHRSLPSAY